MQRVPAEFLGKKGSHKVPRTGLGAPARGRARPCGGRVVRGGACKHAPYANTANYWDYSESSAPLPLLPLNPITALGQVQRHRQILHLAQR